MARKTVEQYRAFLKDSIRQQIDFSQTAQNRGVPVPPVQKPYSPEQTVILLPGPEAFTPGRDIGLIQAIEHRQSRRAFSQAPLQLAELALLLWATQGVREVVHDAVVLRTVPSAGCRHAFETYLCVLNVDDVSPGVYRYLPLEHGLVLERKRDFLAYDITEAALHQSFCGRAAVVFIWTTLPVRMEWRYGLAAHRVILIDAGHVCQNLYLACEAIGAGTSAVAAYDQDKVDALLQVDGQDEFTIYMAAVGKV